MSDNDEAVGRFDGVERPSRLMDLADNRGGTDRDLERVGALLSKVAPPAGLTAVQLLRVRERLDQSTHSEGARRRPTRFFDPGPGGLVCAVGQRCGRCRSRLDDVAASVGATPQSSGRTWGAKEGSGVAPLAVTGSIVAEFREHAPGTSCGRLASDA